MLKTISIFLLCFLTAIAICNGQVLSNFSWTSGSVTTATVGVSAVSSSSSATISSGGSNGNGLNPGLPKTNANLTIMDQQLLMLMESMYNLIINATKQPLIFLKEETAWFS